MASAQGGRAEFDQPMLPPAAGAGPGLDHRQPQRLRRLKQAENDIGTTTSISIPACATAPGVTALPWVRPRDQGWQRKTDHCRAGLHSTASSRQFLLAGPAEATATTVSNLQQSSAPWVAAPVTSSGTMRWAPSMTRLLNRNDYVFADGSSEHFNPRPWRGLKALSVWQEPWSCIPRASWAHPSSMRSTTSHRYRRACATSSTAGRR